MKQTDRGTWIDEDGQYADPRTEFIFDPRKNTDTGLKERSGRNQDVQEYGIRDESEENGREQTSLPSENFNENSDESNSNYLMKDGEIVG